MCVSELEKLSHIHNINYSERYQLNNLLKENKEIIENNKIPDHHNLAKTFFQATTDIKDGLNGLINAVSKSNKNITKSLNLLSEENNILWWVFGEYSRDLQKKMDSFEPEVICMIAGKELADLIKITPGPQSIEAFLLKIMEVGKTEMPDKIILKDAVNKSSRDWREQWVKEKLENKTTILCPIHYAVQTSLLTDDDESWGEIYNKNNGKTSLEVSPLSFAKQVYLEGLLLKNLK